MTRRALLDWQPYGLIPCELLERFDATPTTKAARVRITAAQGPCLPGEVYTVNSDAVTECPSPLLDWLAVAAEFAGVCIIIASIALICVGFAPDLKP